MKMILKNIDDFTLKILIGDNQMFLLHRFKSVAAAQNRNLNHFAQNYIFI